MSFVRQVAVLVYKNILIAFVRRPITTILRALVLPILIGWFFSYARNFFAAPSLYGVGSPNPVRSFQDALALSGSRNRLVFVNSGFSGGQIDQIITEVGDIARNAGKTVVTTENEDDLLVICRNTLRGASPCIGGVVFHSSPTEPEGQGLPYNYTLRFDGIFGATIFVDRDTNDAEIYSLPLQRAIDQAIANANGTLNADAVGQLEEFPFTSQTDAQRNTSIRLRYMRALINFLGVGFFIGMCGVQYQQVGAQATERELKMSQLLEVMMPNKRRWEPQVARLLSYHIAFTMLYFPGWLIMAIILKVAVFERTSMGVLIGLHLLTGLSLASFSLFAAAFFKKAQLSGISTILLSIVVAIIAQVIHLSDVAVYVLGIIFPSVNYVLSINFMARFERRNLGAVLTQSAPNTTLFSVKGEIFWIFLGIQIVVYPLLAVVVERLLWGTASGKRHLSNSRRGMSIELQNFSKHFRPSWIPRLFPTFLSKKSKAVIRAVDDLSFAVHQGQIVVLLGANGSGKSTTLDAIAGLSKPTKGDITVNFDHGIGFCPQQNVLWKDLTVYEHVRIFDNLKSLGKRSTKTERLGLIADCDMDLKTNAKAGSLSGGQMRKLQLACMFIGKSGICLVDECSSGIDPLARKKIQDILLAERSRSQRTILFTSHYLDEADIADYILIMSKGKLKVHGTAPEIKHSGQYRIHIFHSAGQSGAPHFENISRQELYNQTTYIVSSATSASKLLAEIEAQGFHDYSIDGPTVEDTFMAVAEEMSPTNDNVTEVQDEFKSSATKETSIPSKPEAGDSESDSSPAKGLDIHTGTYVGPVRQAFVLYWKRWQVFLRGVLPNLIALVIVPLAAGLTSRFLEGFQRAGCIPDQNVLTDASQSLVGIFGYGRSNLVLGPQSAWTNSALRLILESVPQSISASFGNALPSLLSGVPFVNTETQFYQYVQSNTQRLGVGGLFLGDTQQPSVIAYQAQYASDVAFPVLLQNVVSILKYGNPIAVTYQPFDIPWQAGQGNTLQYTIYFGLVLSVAPAFFGLYPTLERLRHVRGLHYSNGVRALPLWLSYTVFDFQFVLVAAAIAIAILATRFGTILFGIGYFWLVMVLYGLCATLCAYMISLYARSQLAAFAFAAAYQAASCLLWLIAYLSLVTYGDPNHIDRNLNYAHFTLSLIMPSGSLFKALFVSLNVLSINCRGSSDYVGSPGDITAYGGPILYLVVQSVLLFVVIVWRDSGVKLGSLLWASHRTPDQEEKRVAEQEVVEELERVTKSTDDGLRVLHMSKAYGKNLAVDDASFGVKRGEVFGLLGPNGAGKSTTISVIRGDIKANKGDVYIENLSLLKNRTRARQHLSACPQHDAMDRLTVTEHLKFYARIRGVKDVIHNTTAIIHAVGLTPFKDRMADQLSGGNKRKLSLGIALTGNPAVMLLDEPSSGMDVAAKRTMWRTLEAVLGGRSIVLTTHSMEEADRLCHRAAILARHLLTVGTVADLKRRHGDRYHVHLLLRTAPHTLPTEDERVRAWVGATFAGAVIDPRSHHGQIRFSVPTTVTDNTGGGEGATPIASLFATLESHKQPVGYEYYSISHATLDQVFLNIVTKHDVEEENAGTRQKQRQRGWRAKLGWSTT